MRLIEDLGTQGKHYNRFGMYECPDCKSVNRHSTSDVKRGKIVRCAKCSAKLKGEKSKTHGESGSKLWNVWSHMNDRCYNTKSNSYKWYGERGITVCKEWRGTAEKFIEWAKANGYKNGLTIDRVNNDKPYSPDNCRWTTMKVQCSNRRRKSGTTSKYPGVSWKKSNLKWQCAYKGKYLGLFNTEIEAKNAYEDYKDRQLFEED